MSIHRIRRLARPLGLILAIHLFLVSGPHAVATAALVATESAADPGRVAEAREAVRRLMAREDIVSGLARLGVDPEEAAARAASLSDAEALTLARAAESLPAGGNPVAIIVGAVLIVFLVLLITDILGYTDVFPFTKRHR